MNMSKSEWEASIQRVGVVVGCLVLVCEIAELEKAGLLRAPWIFDVISKFEYRL